MPSRITARLLAVGFLALLLNSAYLWAFADPTVWYFVQVGLHPVLGLVLAAGVVWSAIRYRFSADTILRAGLAVSAAGLVLGVAVIMLGATTPFRRLLSAHVAISTLGT